MEFISNNSTPKRRRTSRPIFSTWGTVWKTFRIVGASYYTGLTVQPWLAMTVKEMGLAVETRRAFPSFSMRSDGLMTDKFVREEHLVKLMMQRLGISAAQYFDPNAAAGKETGVDVVAVTDTARIGIQVTELDTGNAPGQSRGEEKKQVRAARDSSGGVYGGWAQNGPAKMLEAIQRSISRKAAISQRHDFADLDEIWLLISCGVPELGSVVSTFVMTKWLDVAALNNATLAPLSDSKYTRAFLHPVLGVEQAIYHWAPHQTWEKDTQQETPAARGPSFWGMQRAANRYLGRSS